MIQISPNSCIQRHVFVTIDEFLIIELSALLETSTRGLRTFLALHYISELVKSALGKSIEIHFDLCLIITRGFFLLLRLWKGDSVSFEISLVISQGIHPADSKVDIWVKTCFQKRIVIDLIYGHVDPILNCDITRRWFRLLLISFVSRATDPFFIQFISSFLAPE